MPSIRPGDPNADFGISQSVRKGEPGAATKAIADGAGGPTETTIQGITELPVDKFVLTDPNTLQGDSGDSRAAWEQEQQLDPKIKAYEAYEKQMRANENRMRAYENQMRREFERSDFGS